MISEEELMKQYEEELKRQEQDGDSNYIPTMYPNQQKQNLVEWELDFKPELEDIERLLRCDVYVTENGRGRWVQNPDKSKIFLNDLGVNDVLRKIRLLVNKNKVLSNYNIEEIKQRVRLIGHELRVLIYNNYEMYGIDNEYKMHNYPMIVLTIMSIVEDSYRRALGGETHKGLNEQRLVQQTDSVVQQQYPQMMQPKQKRWYNPFSWGG